MLRKKSQVIKSKRFIVCLRFYSLEHRFVHSFILLEIYSNWVACVINSSNVKCKGRITRQRVTKKKKEESIIDFVLVCELMDDMVEELLIDEDKKYALTSYTKTKNGAKVKESDHNSLITIMFIKLWMMFGNG